MKVGMQRVPRKRKLRKFGLAAILIAAAGLSTWWLVFGGEALDTRFTGAYRLDDGTLVMIAPREGDTLRYRLMSGKSAALRPAGEGVFEAGSTLR